MVTPTMPQQSGDLTPNRPPIPGERIKAEQASYQNVIGFVLEIPSITDNQYLEILQEAIDAIQRQLSQQ